jgi:pimeloyl-ACP methyl ester carboxylesterase
MAPYPSNFKTAAGEAKYIAAYNATLTLWPVPYESLQIATRWGSTHVLASGPPDAPPLMLLHGMNLSATMWFPNVADLSDHSSGHYRVYAVDTIGSAGKSVATQPLQSRADFVGWLNDVFDALQLVQSHVLGHSHGGWLALNFALSAPERVNRMILLAPAASFRPLASQFYLRGIPTMLFPTRSLLTSFMRWMTVDGFVVNELFVEQFVLGMKHVRSQIKIWPTVFTDDELQQIKARTLLLIGDQEVIYKPTSALIRAKRLIPNIEAEIVPNAGHGLPMEQPVLVNERILGFLNQER